jgi:hypothetical protein
MQCSQWGQLSVCVCVCVLGVLLLCSEQKFVPDQICTEKFVPEDAKHFQGFFLFLLLLRHGLAVEDVWCMLSEVWLGQTLLSSLDFSSPCAE